MQKEKQDSSRFYTKERFVNGVKYTLAYYAAIAVNILIADCHQYWNFAWQLALLEVVVVVIACEFVRAFIKFHKFKIWHFICFDIAIVIANMFLVGWLSESLNLFYVATIELSGVYLAAMIGNPFIVINEKKRIEEVRRMEEEKHRLELYYLNLQLNPHFLFNTLNVIYVQSRKEKAATTSDMVMHLSEMLRYQLYESVDNKVLLKSEIKHIENYIELQKMRQTDLHIDYQTEGTFDGIMLYPFMSISFLENAFKFVGVNNSGEKFVKIFVGVDEKYVSFVVQNTKCEDAIASQPSKPKSSGIGIENTKKRLDLLYPGKYSLEIKDDSKYFIVELKILIEND
ncbi:MAG: histidine kinase [Bacteroidales bacterium]|nr:histidine kinase [Bacteroidales bacterium]